MKTITFKQEVTRPVLEIRYDDSPESPREWCNLGYFITNESRYSSPDREPDLVKIVEETQYGVKNAEQHMRAITKMVKDLRSEKVLYITPVFKYEHSGVAYRRGTASGWDYSNCGFYIVTDKSAREGWGDKVPTVKRMQEIIDSELETYTQWANGEVYCFILYDENGDVSDSCCGFYDLDAIKDYLPEEWKDEDLSEYLKY